MALGHGLSAGKTWRAHLFHSQDVSFLLHPLRALHSLSLLPLLLLNCSAPHTPPHSPAPHTQLPAPSMSPGRATAQCLRIRDLELVRVRDHLVLPLRPTKENSNSWGDLVPGKALSSVAEQEAGSRPVTCHMGGFGCHVSGCLCFHRIPITTLGYRLDDCIQRFGCGLVSQMSS